MTAIIALRTGDHIGFHGDSPIRIWIMGSLGGEKDGLLAVAEVEVRTLF
jgi:hypothetical protein